MKYREVFLPGTAFIDVGANIGNHSVFFAAILNASVYAFEPFPPNHALLELNIAANGLDDGIIASHHGIGEITGTATLHPGQPDNFGTTRLSSALARYRSEAFTASPFPLLSA
jgi:FkbM family methyltransferase